MALPLIFAAGAASVAAIVAYIKRLGSKAEAALPKLPVGGTKLSLSSFPGIRVPSDPTVIDQVRVTLPNGEVWEVAPEYIGPVGIGEAADIAKSMGLQLPTPELVDAIWNAADLKTDPLVRNHDGTPKTMATPEVFEKQRLRIADFIGGRQYKLLAGTHKDVVMLSNGKPGLYGWNADETFAKRSGIPTHAVRGASGVPVKAGRVVQQEFGGHGLDWKDYSQGLRLVRKVG